MKRIWFSPLIGAVLLCLLILFAPTSWFQPLLTEKKIENEAVELKPTTFEGVAIQGKMLKNNKFLPIYGSSELSRFDPFHPSNYFKVNPEGFTPFLVGRGGTASMYHFLNFAVHEKDLKDKKIVFVISPQWFVKAGEDDNHFSSNFSALKAYQFALHPHVNEDIVERGAKRMLCYQIVKSDPLLSTLLEARANPSKKQSLRTKIAFLISKPYVKVMERRDLLLSILTSHNTDIPTHPHLTKGKTWDELEQNAIMYGQKQANNNPFFIKNQYYNRMYKAKIKRLKGYKRHETLDKSPQYDDFQMMLDVLKEAGAKPLFVSVPVNGYWYDYAKSPKHTRQTYYRKIKTQVEKEGFPILDLSTYEHEKHFMTDGTHIGYKGWVEIDKGIQEFMKK